MGDEEWMSYLKEIYYNPKHAASFSSPIKLHQFLKSESNYELSLKDIKKWLSTQEPYTLHRSVRRRFHRNRVMVSGIDDQVHIIHMFIQLKKYYFCSGMLISWI